MIEGENGGSTRWQAPELSGPGAQKTRRSDVYAFGMTILEVCFVPFRSNVYLSEYRMKICTGAVPFMAIRNDVQVLMNVVIFGKKPDKPSNDSCKINEFEDLWDLCLRCWEKGPNMRPIMRHVTNTVCYLSLETFVTNHSVIAR